MEKNGDIFWFKKTGTYILNSQNTMKEWNDLDYGFPFEKYEPKEKKKCWLYEYLTAFDN